MLLSRLIGIRAPTRPHKGVHARKELARVVYQQSRSYARKFSIPYAPVILTNLAKAKGIEAPKGIKRLQLASDEQWMNVIEKLQVTDEKVLLEAAKYFRALGIYTGILRLIEYMDKNDLPVSPVAFRQLIAAALNGNSSNDIYYAYSRLHRAGESLTPEEYLNFMDSCRTSKKSRVVEILYSMIDRDVQVDRRHFQRALMACANAGNLSACNSLFELAADRNIWIGDIIPVAKLIVNARLDNEAEVMKLLAEFQSTSDNFTRVPSRSLSALARFFIRQGNEETVMACVRQMLHYSDFTDTRSSKQLTDEMLELSNGFTLARMHEVALKVVNLLYTRGFAENPCIRAIAVHHNICLGNFDAAQQILADLVDIPIESRQRVASQVFLGMRRAQTKVPDSFVEAATRFLGTQIQKLSAHYFQWQVGVLRTGSMFGKAQLEELDALVDSFYAQPGLGYHPSTFAPIAEYYYRKSDLESMLRLIQKSQEYYDKWPSLGVTKYLFLLAKKLNRPDIILRTAAVIVVPPQDNLYAEVVALIAWAHAATGQFAKSVELSETIIGRRDRPPGTIHTLSTLLFNHFLSLQQASEFIRWAEQFRLQLHTSGAIPTRMIIAYYCASMPEKAQAIIKLLQNKVTPPEADSKAPSPPNMIINVLTNAMVFLVDKKYSLQLTELAKRNWEVISTETSLGQLCYLSLMALGQNPKGTEALEMESYWSGVTDTPTKEKAAREMLHKKYQTIWEPTVALSAEEEDTQLSTLTLLEEVLVRQSDPNPTL